MKIYSVTLKNFRSYLNSPEIPISNLSLFVGQNDVGKSTILEALDIYFNDSKATNPFSSDDLNKKSGSKESTITVKFITETDAVVIDASNKVSLRDEYLLNTNGQLEIIKCYQNAKLKEILLKANYPTNNELSDLLDLSIDELKDRVTKLNLLDQVQDKRKSADYRYVIRNQLAGKIVTSERAISIYKDKDEKKSSGKDIWKKLQEALPLFVLFQADRKNEEKDSEVQDPLKIAIKSIIQDANLASELAAIKARVEEATKLVADKTIEKLKQMNPTIASTLYANFPEPKWEKAFEFSIESDEGIPLDKRGSGVRRLILLNFFRAEAERKSRVADSPTIIYAIEEPETSQHPIHQELLINSLLEISKAGKDQIILTTHSPGIAKLIPIESIRLVKRDDNSAVGIHWGSDILRETSETLGVLPTIELDDSKGIKLAICLEGKFDIKFFQDVSAEVQELRDIFDCNQNKNHVFVLMGGGNLQHWVNENYLEKLKLAQVHIYDSDLGSAEEKKYQPFVEKVNSRGKGDRAFLTQYRELENYFSPSIIKTEFEVEIPYDTNWPNKDISEFLAKELFERNQTEKKWHELEVEKRKDKIKKAKSDLNKKLTKKISKKSLDEINSFEEVKSWFEIFRQLSS